MKKKTVISAASYYNSNYYFAKEFEVLPPEVKKEIKSITINAADISKGVFCISFNENGDIILESGGMEGDNNYDEIEGKLQIKYIEAEKSELLKQLVLWQKIKLGGV